MNSFQKFNIFGLLALLASICSYTSASPEQTDTPNKPNIIWLMAEDISMDLECNGMAGVQTPNLNQLAKRGVQYSKCYSTSPVCSPNRSAMMTGTHQQAINAHQHRSNKSTPLAEPYKPLTHYLQQAGYTCILGSPFVLKNGQKTDLNFAYEPVGTWKKNKGLFDKLDEIEPADVPFFAQIQLKVTHRGDWWNEIRAQSKDPVDPDEIELPPYIADHPITRLDWAKYLDQIEYMDHEIGLVLEDLKAKGLLENTIIIFIGDNGRCNIRGKGYLFEPGIHVPLIIAGPKGFEGGQIRNELVTTTDITATILDIAGIEVPKHFTGMSFLEENFHREYVFATRDGWDEIADKSKCLSDGAFKYIRNDMSWVPYDAHGNYLEFYRPALHVMRKLKLEGKLTKDQLAFFAPKKPKEEFYDLKNDPYELHNLIDDPEHQSQIDQFRNQLQLTDLAYQSPNPTDHSIDSGMITQMINYLKYEEPETYLKLLQGEEVGFQKYRDIYKEFVKQSSSD